MPQTHFLGLFINEQAYEFLQKEAYSAELALQHHSMRPYTASNSQLKFGAPNLHTILQQFSTMCSAK